MIPKVLTDFVFGIGMVNTKKYQPILTKKYQFDTTLVNSYSISYLYQIGTIDRTNLGTCMIVL